MNYEQRALMMDLTLYAILSGMGTLGLFCSNYILIGFLAMIVLSAPVSNYYRKRYFDCSSCGEQVVEIDSPILWIFHLWTSYETYLKDLPESCQNCGSPIPSENERRLKGLLGKCLDLKWPWSGIISAIVIFVSIMLTNFIISIIGYC